MLSFEPATHIYRWDGVIVPSVTQILNEVGISDYSGIPAAQRDAYMRFGTAVHLACELWDRRELDLPRLDPMLAPYLNSWIKFRTESGFEIYESEKPQYSLKHRFAGTPDRIGTLNGRRVVVDIKSSVDTKQGADLQTAGYAILFNEGKPRGAHALDRYSVHLKDNGKYKIEPHKDRNDINAFLSCLSMYNIKKMRGKLCK